MSLYIHTCTLNTINIDNQIGDEIHYILECKMLNRLRGDFLIKEYCYAPNTKKLYEIMSSTNAVSLIKLYMFILKLKDVVISPHLLLQKLCMLILKSNDIVCSLNLLQI